MSIPTKTLLITGGNSGLGFECVKNITKTSEWHIVMASRNQAKSAQTVEKLIARTAHQHIQTMSLNLASLASVRSFVEEFSASEHPPLQALICNAGVQNISDTYYTEDGYEMTFGVNHLGHFLLTLLLLPHLVTPARIVFVSSGTHDPEQKTMMPPPKYTTARNLAFPAEDTEMTKQDIEYLGRQRYSTSKLCNVLCVYELVRRLQTAGYTTLPNLITVNAFEPGLMPGTGLARDYAPLQKILWSTLGPLIVPFIPFAHTATQSGRALARLILDPNLQSVTGKYFDGHKEISSSKTSYDTTIAKDLWDTSMELTGVSPNETFLAN